MSDKSRSQDPSNSNIDWNEHAAYWDDYKDAREYTKQTLGILSERLDLTNLCILDFGCGTGILTEHMAKKAKQIVAIDTSEKMIEVLANKNLKNVVTINDELSKDTIEKHTVFSNKFDLVVASSVCAFLPNYKEVLKLIKSLLKPEALFFQWDWLKHKEDEGIGFTEQTIEDSFTEVGLKVDSIGVPFHFSENEEKMEVIMAIGKL